MAAEDTEEVVALEEEREEAPPPIDPERVRRREAALVHVRVRGHDEHGEELTVEASGLEARVIQHEVDHLDGMLILDRVSRGARKEAMRTLRERSQEAA